MNPRGDDAAAAMGAARNKAAAGRTVPNRRRGQEVRHFVSPLSPSSSAFAHICEGTTSRLRQKLPPFGTAGEEAASRSGKHGNSYWEPIFGRFVCLWRARRLFQAFRGVPDHDEFGLNQSELMSRDRF
jgi:hypothetical protein